MERLAYPRFPFAHTYSIVARDPETGFFGVAVQSHWFSVGSVVAWAEPGTGAVATQAIAEVNYGPLGLELMRFGKSASESLKKLLANDERREYRQVAMVDSQGRVATHTGTKCIGYASHLIGEQFSVQANMMKNPDVVPAMAKAYREAQGDLAERLMVTLEAAQAAGGDIRGQQSAALIVVGPTRSKYPWNDTIMDLRVEDRPNPLVKLRSLLNTQRAYTLMNRGDQLLAQNDIANALEAYSSAAALAPDIEELPFWKAVTLADIGRLDEALPIFKEVFAINPNFAELATRLPQVGLLPDDEAMMKSIQAQLPKKK